MALAILFWLITAFFGLCMYSERKDLPRSLIFGILFFFMLLIAIFQTVEGPRSY